MPVVSNSFCHAEFPIAHELRGTSDLISVLMFVGDVLIIIRDPPSPAVLRVVSTMCEMDTFGQHTGLAVKLSKAAILLQGY